MSEDIYSAEQGVNIHIVNEKQILLVPLLGCRFRSDAAKIYDYPIDASFLGEQVADYFDQMDRHELMFAEKYKNFWLLPKGITSWKKFEKSALTLLLLHINGNIELYRNYLSSDGGFVQESDNPNLVLIRTISSKELGEIILSQFEYIRNIPRI